MLTDKKYKELADILNNEHTVTFKDGNINVYIVWYDGDDITGYYYDLINPVTNEVFDGGLCTGNPEDAVKMYLEANKESLKELTKG